MRVIGLGRRAVVIALALTFGLLAGGCGGGKEVSLTIGTHGTFHVYMPGGTAEEAVLGEIYAQALEGAGYDVVRRDDFGVEVAEATRALEHGKISGYLDHLGGVLTTSLGQSPEQGPADAQKAFQDARRGLRKRGLTAIGPTPFNSNYAVEALRETAEERGLKTISDLSGQSQDLTNSGPMGCHGALNCAGGLETFYGLRFAGFIQAPAEPFKALERGFTDLTMLPATDGQLAAEKDKFVALEDDKHLLPAGNAIFVTTPRVIKEAGPDFEETIVAAQKGLTLPVIQKLDARVEIEHQTPRAVAAGYLRQIGLSG